eukprot:6176002-Pleurochrysis_carterae.AAC.1
MTSPQGIIQAPAVQSWTDIKIYDHDSLPVPDNSSLQPACMNAVRRRLQRKSLLPELFMDPLKPLPLADAAVPKPAVHIVYLIMASRPYAHETISRNVRALQRPGAANDLGCNDSNLFLIHVDAKMAADKARSVLDAVGARPDVYFLKRSRAVMWAGWSMMLVLMDVMASLLERSLGFDLLINLSDADLSLRVDGEIRAFFSRFPGRSVMSIVQRKRDPRRYQMHERFRQYCWVSRSHRLNPNSWRMHARDPLRPHNRWFHHKAFAGAPFHPLRLPSSLSLCVFPYISPSPAPLCNPTKRPSHRRIPLLLSGPRGSVIWANQTLMQSPFLGQYSKPS